MPCPAYQQLGLPLGIWPSFCELVCVCVDAVCVCVDAVCLFVWI